MNTRVSRVLRSLALLPVAVMAGCAPAPAPFTDPCPAGVVGANEPCAPIGSTCVTTSGVPGPPGPGDAGGGLSCVGAPVRFECRQNGATGGWQFVSGGCVPGPLPPPELLA
ncbi:MAG: hypothetical protein JNK05_37030 [Myxococcales bacterium]|nr:hypothetical protein [Myxococcales bacterium]